MSPLRAADDRPYPSVRLLVVLMAMNMVAYLDRSILTLAAPAVRADLGLNHVQLSILLGTGFVIAFVTLGIPFGWLVDRSPRRRVVMAGIVCWSLAASAAGLVRSFGGLLVARIGVGAGEAALNPSAYSMITDATPRRRLALALTLYGSSTGLGGAVSLGVGGALLGYATAHGSFTLPGLGTLRPWQFVLLLSGLPGLLLAPLIFAVPEPARRDRLAAAGRTGAAPGFVRFLRDRWRFYLPVFAGQTLLQFGAYSFSAWQPTYMVQRFGWAIGSVGGALSVGMVTAFVGSFVAGWAVDALIARGIIDAPLRWTAGAWLWSAMLVGAAFLVASPWVCLGLVFVAQLPIATIGIVSTAVQEVTPNDYRGRTSALFLLAGNLVGFGLGPLAPAALTDYVFHDDAQLGLAVAIVMFVTGPLGALLLWLGCRPMRDALQAPLGSPEGVAAQPDEN